MARRETIYLRGEPPHQEGFNAGAYDLTPGMLVAITADGEVEPHATAGGTGAALYVRENFENDGAGIDDDIASGDTCTVIFAAKGDVINALTSDTVAAGDELSSAGDGTVTAAGSGDAIIGVARRADDGGRVHLIVV